jgi:hypothetical protein
MKQEAGKAVDVFRHVPEIQYLNSVRKQLLAHLSYPCRPIAYDDYLFIIKAMVPDRRFQHIIIKLFNSPQPYRIILFPDADGFAFASLFRVISGKE